jgi:NAD(P)-dependent dehydrogenase (short-subunit alcohol dehydrogenase family)
MNNKIVLITGATSGIGFATTEILLKDGYKVYAAGRDKFKFENYYNSRYKNMLIFYQIDLRDIYEIEGIYNFIQLRGDKLNGLVHCAGVEETIPLSLYSSQKVKSIFELNVFSTIELLRLFSKKKYSEDKASVVLISSVMGVLGQSGKVGYCATKASILGVVKASALELVKREIRVNAILPGIVNTPMSKKLFDELGEESVKKIKDMHPLGIGEVKDVVPAIKFLLSEDSRWITGQNIVIDGGYSIQ